MKNSGIPWIGEIPKEWTIELIGNQVKEVNNPNTNGLEDNALQFKMGSIISKSRGDSKYNPETLEGYNIVDKGVIMLNGLNLSFDLISQRVGLVRERGVITSTYLAVKPSNNIDSEYLTYLFKAYDNCKAFHSMGRGLRQTLSYGELRKYLLLYPSLDEQQRIAEFLDRKCAEVDEMIGLQEQIIEELKAYKQSVITEAVTKGLNPDAPMRDSDIDWIGSIPEHWEVKRLKNVADLNPTLNAQIEQDSLVAYMPMECLRNGIIQERIAPYSEVASYTPFKDDDVVMAKVTPCFENGNIAVATNLQGGYGFGTSEIFVIRCGNEAHNKYAFYYLQSAYIKNLGVSSMTGTGGLKRVNPTILNNSYFLSTSVAEQQAIADYLDEKCADIDSLIQTKQSKIDSLKEYKKSIIYEYVTGKREVNE